MINNQVDLSSFKHVLFTNNLIKFKYFIWLIVSNLFFLTNIPYPNCFKVTILRLFGAKIGNNCIIKPWVKIKFPWELEIGNSVWIGEDVWIDNISKVSIMNNVCISQAVLIITGNHMYNKVNFDLVTSPINLEDGVWICAKAIVTGGVTCKTHAVLGINCVASRDLEPYTIYKVDKSEKSRIIL